MLMGWTYCCEYPKPNGICIPNENPSGKVYRSVVSDSNLNKKDVSKEKENVVKKKEEKEMEDKENGFGYKNTYQNTEGSWNEEVIS